MLTIEKWAVRLGLNTRSRQGLGMLSLALALGLGAQLGFVSLNIRLGLPLFNMGGWWDQHLVDGSLLPGLVIYALAAFLFVQGLRLTGDRPAAFSPHTGEPARQSPRLSLWLTSLGLSGCVAYYASFADPDDKAGYGFALLWLLSIALLVFSVLNEAGWRPARIRALPDWLRAHRSETLAVAAILIGAFLIRVVDLELRPYAFLNDEGQIGLGAVCLLQHACTNLFALGWAEQSMVAYLPAALGVSLFGRTALAVRLGSASLGTLATLAVYLFARETLDRRLAWLAALFLATLPVQVHFSRLGVNNILDSLSAGSILWLVFRGMKTSSKICYLAAGLLSGLCFYSYQGSLLAPALAAGAFAYVAWRTPGFLRTHARHIVIFLGAALIVALPMLGYYSTNSDLFLSRFKAEGVMENGILQLEIKKTGQNPAQLLATSFVKSSLVYIAGPAPFGFFNSPYPYLSWPAALLFIFGLVYAAWRIKDPPYLALLAWFFAPVIMGSTLTGGAPTSQRMLMSMPAAALIAALGLTRLFAAIPASGRIMTRYAPLLLLVVVLCNGALDLRFYFYDYQAGHYFEDQANELTYETRQDIAPLGTHGRLFIIGDQDTPYLDFPNFAFFSPDVEMAYLYTVTPATLAALPHDKDLLFIAAPSHVADLKLITEWIPGGREHDVNRRFQPEQALYYSYKITKEQLQAFKP